jgi:GNAT superfamily N-acetyltransferase
MGLNDAASLSSFAEACFREAYTGDFVPASLEALCRVAFTETVIAGLIRNGAWVAGDWQGYVARGETPCPISGLAKPIGELARLYVPRRWQGTGVADRLMAIFLSDAEDRGDRSLWLQAHANSPRALAFYRRWGFDDYGFLAITCEGVLLPHRALGRRLSDASS